MEIDIKINQTNAFDQPHGYFEEYYVSNPKRLYGRYHHFNGKIVGYIETFKQKNGEINFKCHCHNNELIGCEQYRQSQFYFNKLSKKFGEEIAWK